jgi:oxygen-independent coproporphyrinogen-3 oxidase
MEGSGGVYLHIPFCRVHCPYCNFRIVLDRHRGGKLSYLHALLLSLERDPPPFSTRTLYLGGGTPSRLSLSELELLLSRFLSIFPSPPEEVTIEVNPEDLHPELLALLHELGVTRLSIGLQRRSPGELKTLGRSGSIGALSLLEELVGTWSNLGHKVSLDLLYGIPGEREEDLLDLLYFCLDLPIHHLSAYALTIEPGTAMERWFLRSRGIFPDDDTLARFYRIILDTLLPRGWIPYEVSNFARTPDDLCMHNLFYWQYRPYIGYGLASASLLFFEDGWVRFRRADDLSLFLSQPEGRQEVERLSPKEILLERLFLGLRSIVGIPEELWEIARAKSPSLLARFEESSRVERRGGRIILEPSARFLSDEVALRLFSILESEAVFLLQFFDESEGDGEGKIPAPLTSKG